MGIKNLKLEEYSYVVIPTQNIRGMLWEDTDLTLNLKAQSREDIMYLCNLDIGEENGK